MKPRSIGYGPPRRVRARERSGRNIHDGRTLHPARSAGVSEAPSPPNVRFRAREHGIDAIEGVLAGSAVPVTQEQIAIRRGVRRRVDDAAVESEVLLDDEGRSPKMCELADASDVKRESLTKPCWRTGDLGGTAPARWTRNRPTRGTAGAEGGRGNKCRRTIPDAGATARECEEHRGCLLRQNAHVTPGEGESGYSPGGSSAGLSSSAEALAGRYP